jgi:hypothetical protein
LTLDELNDELDACSRSISTQLRTINFGVLGVAWVLLLKQHDVGRIADNISERGLLCVALACIVFLIADLLQYVFGERAADEAFDRAEKSESQTASYHEESFDYRAQLCCYRFKLWLTCTTAFGLLVLVGWALF